MITPSISMRVKDDGVYLFYAKLGKAVNEAERKDVKIQLIGKGVVDIDEIAMWDLCDSGFESGDEKRISVNIKGLMTDADVEITITRDQMEALAVPVKPGILGRNLTAQKVIDKLTENKVSFGIDQDEIKKMVNNAIYGNRYIVAAGIKPVDGENGRIDLQFETGEKSNKPKELDDGRVDFKQVDFFIPASPRQTLAVLVPAKDGTPGTNVHGAAVDFKPGKPAPRLPKGKGTEVSEDGFTLYALVGGQISLINNMVNVLPILEISGDVGNETGNIVFDGTVIVAGVATTGFSIQATGDVEVKGMAEGVTIEAGGNVTLHMGIQGVEKAVIKAGGDISARFIQHSELHSKRNIISDDVRHSNIDCEGAVLLEGKKRRLVGGKIRAGKYVSAAIIGSNMATQTEVTVGNSPELLEKYDKKVSELLEARKEYDRVSQVVDMVLKAGDLAQLDIEKKKILHRAMTMKKELRVTITELQAVVDKMLEDMNVDKGEIKVQDIVYSGVKVTIGDAVKHVRDDIQNCTLRVFEGKIAIAPY